jgi:hypothetical protein
MTQTVVTSRLFPTFDFVIRTAAPREAVIDTLSAAMREKPERHWPLPRPTLRGTIEGGTFTCRPHTSAFGGSAAPSVAGEIIPRHDGGTDVIVRVRNWFALLMAALVVIADLALVHASAAAERLAALGMAAWLLLICAGIYAAEAAFVRGIFKRIFSVR